MTFHPRNYQNTTFQLAPGCPKFQVDLNHSFRQKQRGNESITNAIALQRFKEIQWEADVLSFFTKPAIAIALSFGILAVGVAVTVSMPMSITALFISTLGGTMIGYSIENSLNGYLSELSQAYDAQSQKASVYISSLEHADHEALFTLNE